MRQIMTAAPADMTRNGSSSVKRLEPKSQKLAATGQVTIVP